MVGFFRSHFLYKELVLRGDFAAFCKIGTILAQEFYSVKILSWFCAVVFGKLYIDIFRLSGGNAYRL